MPSESVIRKKAIEILEKEKWVTWHPSRARFKQNDIFGIIDLLAAKGNRIKKIQLTTLPNVSVRRKKITGFLEKNKIQMTVEVWAWDKKNKKFKKINIRGVDKPC